MAIVYIQKKKLQRNLILVFLAVLLVLGFVIWRGFFGGEKIEAQKEKVKTPQEGIRIDFGVLKNPILQSFQPFLAIQPFEAGTNTTSTIGRDNPFLPY